VLSRIAGVTVFVVVLAASITSLYATIPPPCDPNGNTTSKPPFKCAGNGVPPAAPATCLAVPVQQAGNNPPYCNTGLVLSGGPYNQAWECQASGPGAPVVCVTEMMPVPGSFPMLYACYDYQECVAIAWTGGAGQPKAPTFAAKNGTWWYCGNSGNPKTEYRTAKVHVQCVMH
jgi:hypothetical protein